MNRWRRFIQRLNPYIALALLAVPVAIVEPLKLIALFLFGTGHWITGSAVVLFAYAGSLLVVERLFKIEAKIVDTPLVRSTVEMVDVSARKNEPMVAIEIWKTPNKSPVC